MQTAQKHLETAESLLLQAGSARTAAMEEALVRRAHGHIALAQAITADKLANPK